jgi:hypothetical protein
MKENDNNNNVNKNKINNEQIKKTDDVKKEEITTDSKKDNNINNANKKEADDQIKKIEENNTNTKIEQKDKNKSPKKIYSSVISTGKEKINDIYLKKITDLSNIYNYTSNYLAFISQLFKKISEPFYSKLSSSYINNVKPYLK